MPNLRGTSLVSREGGGYSYAIQTISKSWWGLATSWGTKELLERGGATEVAYPRLQRD